MKTITIKSNGLGRYEDVSPFILSNGRLELKFNLPLFNGQFFFVGENNGKKYKTYIPESGIITLDELTAGELNAEIKHYLKGELIENYKVEPLILRNLNGDLFGTPEIVELQNAVDAINKTLVIEREETLKREEKLSEWKKNIEANLCALIKFAYSDYNSNAYLSGGSIEEFIKEFGFKLSEEQLKTIFGGKEND